MQMSNGEQVDALSKRLVAFYTKYDKAKLASVGELSKKYAGKEAALFKALTEKYGPEPSADEAAAIVAAPQSTAPPVDSTPKPPEAAQAKTSAPATTTATPQKPATPVTSPRPSASDSGEAVDVLSKRLVAFYTKYDKAKLSSVGELSKKYAGKEAPLFKALTEKYGPEPSADEAAAIVAAPQSTAPPADSTPKPPEAAQAKTSAPATTTATPQKPATPVTSPRPSASDSGEAVDVLSKRLVAFYTKYDKAKLASVGELSKKYAGKEAPLFKALTEKYGPEPSADEAAAIVAAPQSTAPPADSTPKPPEAAQAKTSAPATTTATPQKPATPVTSPRPSASDSGEAVDVLSKRLVAFYTKYDKAKLSSVGELSKKYAGKEAPLFKALTEKYGPEPSADEAAAIVAAPQSTAPPADSTPKPPEAAQAKTSAPATTTATPQKPATPVTSPRPSASDSGEAVDVLSKRLVAFYTKYDKAKLSSVGELSKKYAGKEAPLFKALTEKYGPEPSADEAAAIVAAPQSAAPPADSTPKPPETAQAKTSAPATTTATPQKPATPVTSPRPSDSGEAVDVLSKRLVAFYTKYDKAKLSSVGELSKKYAGKEAPLFKALTEKYGPEPSADEAAAIVAAPQSTAPPADSTPKPPEAAQAKTSAPATTTATPQKPAAELAAPPLIPANHAVPPFVSASDNNGDDPVAQLARQLHAFYSEHDRTKLPDVNTLARKYVGLESQLFRTLEKRYQLEPNTLSNPQAIPPPSSESQQKDSDPAQPQAIPAKRTPSTAQLKNFLRHYDPDRIPELDALLAANKGRENELLDDMIREYGPEPGAYKPTAEDKKRLADALADFYRKYDESKLPEVDRLAEKYAGFEHDLLKALAEKYKTPPIPYGMAPSLAKQPRSDSLMPTPRRGDVRNRLRNFLRHYDPDRIPELDALLAANKGREDELLDDMIREYGPEPGAYKPTAEDKKRLADALTDFYRKYDESKLPEVDRLAEKYAGFEHDLLKALAEKYKTPPIPYGMAPSLAKQPRSDSLMPTPRRGDVRNRLRNFLRHYDPDRIPELDALLAANKGREDELLDDMIREYGPEPGAYKSTAEDKKRLADALTDFYRKYDESKLPEVDRLAEKYAGFEHDLLKALAEKYKTPPIPYGMAPSLAKQPRSDSLMPTPRRGDVQNRLRNFLRHYDPDRIPELDALLAANKGREDELLDDMIREYGPEPGAYKPTAEDKKRLADALTDFYRKYDESKLPEVDRLAEKYAGFEHDLLKALAEKYKTPPIPYGMAPSLAKQPRSDSLMPTPRRGDVRNRLRNFLRHYDPDRIPELDALLAANKGREDELLDDMIREYGPEPGAYKPTAEDKKRLADALTDFYRKYDESKLPEVDRLAEKYAGFEHDLLKALAEKYKTPPIPYGMAPSLAKQPRSDSLMPTPRRGDVRNRLRNFLRHYDPDRIPELDALLAANKGREDELLDDMIREYGPEPGAYKPTAEDKKRLADALTDFYRKYDESKLPEVDRLAEKYAGFEHDLLKALAEKYKTPPIPYGMAPSLAKQPRSDSLMPTPRRGDVRNRLRNFLRHYDPDRIPELDALLAANKGREDELLDDMIREYGPEPGAYKPTAEDKKRLADALTDFYRKYDESKLPEVDRLAEKYAGFEHDLLKALAEKYKTPPIPYGMAPSLAKQPRSDSLMPTPRRGDVRNRLRNFLRHYDPDRIPELDALLAANKGREDELLDDMIREYGPEPGAYKSTAEDKKRLADALTDFYRKYDESKLPEVDRFAEKYAGFEHDLLKALAEKYKTPPIPFAIRPLDELSQLIRRLERFYGLYDPSKLPNVPSIAKQFLGEKRTAQLFRALAEKYGPEPTLQGRASADGGTRGARAEPDEPCKPPLSNSDKVMRAVLLTRIHRLLADRQGETTASDVLRSVEVDGSGDPQAALDELVHSLGPEPTDTQVDAQRRATTLQRFSRFFAEKSVPLSAARLFSVCGFYEQEDLFLSYLEREFGPFSERCKKQPPPATPSNAPPLSGLGAAPLSSLAKYSVSPTASPHPPALSLPSQAGPAEPEVKPRETPKCELSERRLSTTRSSRSDANAARPRNPDALLEDEAAERRAIDFEEYVDGSEIRSHANARIEADRWLATFERSLNYDGPVPLMCMDGKPSDMARLEPDDGSALMMECYGMLLPFFSMAMSPPRKAEPSHIEALASPKY